MKNNRYLFFATGVGIFFLIFSSIWFSGKPAGTEKIGQFYQAENYTLQVIQKSNQDILKREIENGVTMPEEKEARKKELDAVTQFEVRFKKKTAEEGLESERFKLTLEEKKYFSFHLEKDLKLIQGQDTLRPVMYHFESSGLQFVPYQTAIVAFENICQKNCERELLINSPLIDSRLVKLTYFPEQS